MKAWLKHFSFYLFIAGLMFPVFGHGYLYIIGGGKRPPGFMRHIVRLAGSDQSKIVIIPNASSRPLDTALHQRYEFEQAGAGMVTILFFDSITVNSDSILNELNGATGIFFSGGDQKRLQSALTGTLLMKKIREIYINGGVIAGTSAGAAVMSTIMITGNELINPDTTHGFNTIQKGNVETRQGFGFVEQVIVDQHFIKRKRNNRLISLVLEHPQYLGIGVDESTAILVYPDNIFEVFGQYNVIVYDAQAAINISANKYQFFSASGIKMHVLTEGQKFNLNTRQPIQ